MGRVAVITDSASDLTADVAAAHGIRIVPLYVRFGETEFRAGVDLSTDEFWVRMLAPDAPFPTTAAASPGDFGAAYEAEFAAGAGAGHHRHRPLDQADHHRRRRAGGDGRQGADGG
jgi:fatty acid-binding protein DegV